MRPDGKAALDHLTRRWICEACVERAITVPEIAERLRTRGWRGEPGALTTTVSKLTSDGYLRCAGQVVRGKRRPSPMFSFERAKYEELQMAVVANAAHHVDAGDEVVLVPANSVKHAALALRSAGPEVLWGIRTGDASVGLLVIVDGKADIDVRDRLLDALQPAGAWRVTAGDVLNRAALNSYCEGLLGAGSATLPPGE